MNSRTSRVGEASAQVQAPAFRSQRTSQQLPHAAPPVERATGKGRRRRAAAEQRLAEQQRWGESLEDEEDDIVLNPAPSNSRRRARRALRRGRIHDDIADYYAGHGYEPSAETWRGQQHQPEDLEIALALSLSLSERQMRSSEGSSSTDGDSNTDLSYENLVSLEAVRVVASQEVVDSLPIMEFKPKVGCANSHSELCTICQVEYIDGDAQLVLPCGHTLHDTCGEQWLCNYSKLCPVCKQELGTDKS